MKYDIGTRIGFERAWGKANRIPEEEQAIAPLGDVAYAHGVAKGEAENEAKAFASDIAYSQAVREEKSRQFGLSQEEQKYQTTTALENKYNQTVDSLAEKARQFGLSLDWTGTRTEKTLTEKARQFGATLSSSASQFNRKLASEKAMSAAKLSEKLYESYSTLGLKQSQFDRSLAWSAEKFDAEMEQKRYQFDTKLEWEDKKFLDEIDQKRQNLDTWMQNQYIGGAIQLANTFASSYFQIKMFNKMKETGTDTSWMYNLTPSWQSKMWSSWGYNANTGTTGL